VTRRRKRRWGVTVPSYFELLEELEQQKRLNRSLTVYVVASGLSEGCEQLADLSESTELRDEFLRKRDTFKALSNLVIKHVESAK